MSINTEELQTQGDIVLNESRLLDILSPLGEVRFAGSYPLRLLVRPDIDVIVTAETPTRDEAVTATKKLLDDGYFQSVVFIDHLSWAKRLDAEMSAKGFYWHLDVPKLGEQWKCDVWYLRPEEDLFVPQTERFQKMLAGNPGARQTILDLKRHFRQGKGYRDGATGTRICSAVLEYGVSNAEEFRAFMAGRTDT